LPYHVNISNLTTKVDERLAHFECTAAKDDEKRVNGDFGED